MSRSAGLLRCPRRRPARARTRRWCRRRRARSPTGGRGRRPGSARGRRPAAGPSSESGLGAAPGSAPPRSRTTTLSRPSWTCTVSSALAWACMITLFTSSERHSWAVSTDVLVDPPLGEPLAQEPPGRAGRPRVAVELELGAVAVAETGAADGGAGAERVGAYPAYRLGRTPRGGVEHPALGLGELPGRRRRTRPARPSADRCPGSGIAAIARVPARRWWSTTPGNRGSSWSRLPTTGSPVRVTAVRGTSSYASMWHHGRSLSVTESDATKRSRRPAPSVSASPTRVTSGSPTRWPSAPRATASTSRALWRTNSRRGTCSDSAQASSPEEVVGCAAIRGHAPRLEDGRASVAGKFLDVPWVRMCR